MNSFQDYYVRKPEKPYRQTSVSLLPGWIS